MIESDYMPQFGVVEARERYKVDYRNGESHLERVSVVVKLRVSHEQAIKLRRKYPGAQPNFLYDDYGESAELEITLRTDDATIEPYLRWRDGILAEIHKAAAEGDSNG